MEKPNFNNFENKFSSPQEELDFLRERITQKETEISEAGYKPEKEKVTQNTLEEYKTKSPEQVLEKGATIPENIREEIVLELSPETHDEKMSELISMVYEKGVSNILDIVHKMNNPHIEDDFHRFLIEYVKSGYPVKGLKEKSALWKSLNRTLYEVTLPERGGDKSEKSLEQLVSLMDQFYTGMLSVTTGDKDDYLSLEITNAIGSREFIFYISVSDQKRSLFQKQLLSVFPSAKIIEQKDDFNIFTSEGEFAGTYLKLDETPAKPIKTYDEFSNDPLKVILNVFSKLDQSDEAASIQLIFKPIGKFYENNYSKALKKIERGEGASDQLHARNTFGSKLASGISGLINGSPKKKSEDSEPAKIDSSMIESIKNKLSSRIVSTNIRVLASAKTENTAESILEDIKSAFNQFSDPTKNSFEFEKLNKRGLRELSRQFTFREFNQSFDIPLNIKEISTLVHLPTETNSVSSGLKTARSASAPAPLELGNEGILLGYNNHQGSKTEIRFNEIDRMRHLYTIGQTGTGKTNFLKSMIIQDIKNGDGVCMIDPHGSDIQDILANIPEERYEDVIYFDPAYTESPMALNMLEYDVNFPEQKTFVVNELFSIFQKLYGGNPESMGPMFEQYFRNATMLVIEDPESGNTLLDVSRVLSDKSYRQLKLSKCKNPIVKQFWEEVADKAGGDAALQNIVPYITSKFDVFLANDIMRPVVAQEKSSFDFRDIMDNKKILLVNLSKGRLGDINSNLIGLILVGKILMAALSRVDSFGKDLSPFYLYIDEFQNVTTDSISTILSEARKYKLSLNVAHQFIAQLDQKTKDSVFGNVGSMAVFRVGSDDAEFLKSQFEPVFGASDIMNIDNYNAYIKVLSGGMPMKPFNMETIESPSGDVDKVQALKEISYQKYGGNRAEIEREILGKYKKESGKTDNPFGDVNI